MRPALNTHPARLTAANWLRTGAVLAVLLLAIGVLVFGFGRTGERIAVLMCVNVLGGCRPDDLLRQYRDCQLWPWGPS